VVDMIPVTIIDVTGLKVAGDVLDTLRARGIALMAAGRETELREWAKSRGLKSGYRSFPTLLAAVKQYERENQSPSANQRAGSI
jgi:hypothetical protein